jgi:hypothetical protein
LTGREWSGDERRGEERRRNYEQRGEQRIEMEAIRGSKG